MPYNENIPGYMPTRDLQILELLAGRIPQGGTIVELGSFLGQSSWTLAKSCDPSVTVYCIDLWDPKFLEAPDMQEFVEKGKPADMLEQFKSHVKECRNIIPIKGGSSTAPWPVERKVDLVFIDADHTSPNVDNDIECWFKRLKPQGVLSGHDFNPYKYPDVVKAVMRKSKQIGIPFKLFGKGLVWAIELDQALYPEHGWIPNHDMIKIINEELKPETNYESDWSF